MLSYTIILRGEYCMKFKNSDQMKSFLKKESIRLGMNIQNTYNTYFSRLLLSRICNYDYGELIVKGSFSQFVHLGKLTRAITDIDLASPLTQEKANQSLLQAIYYTNEYGPTSPFYLPNEQADLKISNDKLGVVCELSCLPTNSSTNIHQFNLVSNFGSIKHNTSIDLDSNYKRTLELKYSRVEPIFTGDEIFYINTLSYEEHLAEKLCIVAESVEGNNSITNTRIKDFYDIYQLHGGKYDFDKFTIYFGKMLIQRARMDKNSLSTKHLDKNFIKNHQEDWNHLSKKYDFLDKDITLEGSVYYTKSVLSEQIQKLKLTNFFLK